jgi:hypothetical protein
MNGSKQERPLTQRYKVMEQQSQVNGSAWVVALCLDDGLGVQDMLTCLTSVLEVVSNL